jgi:hypothetical protein
MQRDKRNWTSEQKLKAIVAIARKIATRLWHLMTEGHCDGLMSDEAYALKLKRIIRDNRIQIPVDRETAKPTPAKIAKARTDRPTTRRKGASAPADGLCPQPAT